MANPYDLRDNWLANDWSIKPSFNRYFSPPPIFQICPTAGPAASGEFAPYIDPHQPIRPRVQLCRLDFNPHGDGAPKGCRRLTALYFRAMNIAGTMFSFGH